MIVPEKNLLPEKGEALYYPHFFTKEESEVFFERLLKEVKWKHEPIKIFGKEIMQPRLTAWFSDSGRGYSYSGITMQAYPWNDVLLAIKNKIETVAAINFNSALLNLYRDGNDSVGWHRDNEKELGAEPVIGSVSLGAPRVFQLREYKKKENIISQKLLHGSLLIMRGESQQHWEHRLPKTTKRLSERINITFRVVGQNP